MNKGYIAVIDSGIGGLSLLYELVKIMPNERYIYFGDNDNAPYGSKTKRELLSLTIENIRKLIPFNLKAIVLACNTLSVSILEELKYYFPSIKFFGVFPPTEIATLRKRKTLLLCTPNTAKIYKNDNYLTVVPLENLAKDIENNVCDLEKVDLRLHLTEAVLKIQDKSAREDLTTFGNGLTTKKLKIIFDHRIEYFEAVILGCTHYFFIKNKIFNHFQPQLIIRGETFTARKVKKELQHQKTLEKTKRFNVLFFGKNASLNSKIFYSITDFKTKSLKIF